MIKEIMHGNWSGTNKLWFDQPSAELSDGTTSVSERLLQYTWSFRGEPHTGMLTLHGPATSFRATWRDSWHHAETTTMHGFATDGLFKLYGTYPDNAGGEWGWRIELDLRDPDVCQLRMFNVEPNGTIHIAVDLRGERAG